MRLESAGLARQLSVPRRSSHSSAEGTEAREVATVRGAGAACKRCGDRLRLFVPDRPFASGEQDERKRGAGGAEDRGHNEPAPEPMRERDRQRRASVQRVGDTGGGDGREDRQPERSADLLRGEPVPSMDREFLSQPEELSPGELRVLRFLPTNLTRPEIARELYVSVHTVNTHIRRIYSKLGARDRSSAVQRARELRLLSTGRYETSPR